MSFTLTGTDVETPASELTFAIPSLPNTVSGTIPANLTYTPGIDFTGFDSFQFDVTDRGDPDNCVFSPCDGPLTSIGTVYVNNPSFETGDLSEWTAQIPTGAFASAAISSLDTVRELAVGQIFSTQEQEAQDAIEAILESGADMNAQDGTYFAFLKTNGPGSYTSVFRTVNVSAGTTISGSAFFFDAETVSDTNACFFSDNAQVQIRDGTGIGGTVLATVFDAAAECGVTGSLGTVPWTPFSYTFPVAGTYTIEARITNTVDSLFDSHMGLDALVIVEAP